MLGGGGRVREEGIGCHASLSPPKAAAAAHVLCRHQSECGVRVIFLLVLLLLLLLVVVVVVVIAFLFSLSS